jgi:hypothetical protein
MATKKGMKNTIFRLIILTALSIIIFPLIPATGVLAATPGLDIGGSGSTSWSIGNIKPGDSGVQTLTLHSNSSYNGILYIWVSDIVNTEGLNPESETGDKAEPGELGNYLLFRINCSSIAFGTTVSMPALINKLPQSAADTNYAKIDPLPSGQTVTLNWEWQLPATTGNDVQGDILTFTINYLLEMAVPQEPATTPVVTTSTTSVIVPTTRVPTSTAGVTTSTTATTQPPTLSKPVTKTTITIDVFGITHEVSLYPDGSLAQPFTISLPDNSISLTISEGTLITADGEIPDRIVVNYTPASEQPLVPDNLQPVGKFYTIESYLGNTRAEHTVFSKPAILRIKYDTAKVQEDSVVFIDYFDTATGWVKLDSTFNAETGAVSADVNHFTVFTVMASKNTALPVRTGFYIAVLIVICLVISFVVIFWLKRSKRKGEGEKQNPK